VDDILVYSENHEDHKINLRQVLNLLNDNGLVVRPDKCAFGASFVEVLGYHIDAEGIRPVTDKVAAIKQFPRPTTIKATQEFLGMMNYYHRFIPNAAAILTPLYNVTSNQITETAVETASRRRLQIRKASISKRDNFIAPRPYRPAPPVN
jgi:hypothetical protein